MKRLRMTLDIAMTILMPLLMAYSLIGETFHEIIGTRIGTRSPHWVLAGTAGCAASDGFRETLPYRSESAAAYCGFILCFSVPGFLFSSLRQTG